MKRQFLAAVLCVLFVAPSSLPLDAATDNWFEITSLARFDQAERILPMLKGR